MSNAWSPFTLGSLQVPGRVILAPMAGYTDLAYRLTCRRLGAPLTASEMILDKSLLRPGKLRNRLAMTDPEDAPVVGQLIGNDPESLASAARLMVRIGFDVVDLNFACPVRKALSRRRGGHLMRDPELASKILRAVAEAVDVPVTVKLRRRFAKDQTDDNFYRIAEAAYEAGCVAVAVHGRSVEARYSGPADWEFLARAKEHFADRTLIGSGDVRSASSAIDMLEQTKVDAVLAARGALGNPWFFQQVQDLAAGRAARRPDLTQQKEVMLEHYRMAEAIYGPRRTAMHMRKFGIKYARMHTRPKQLRMAFVKVGSSNDWQRVLDTYYTEEYEKLGFPPGNIPDAEGLV